MWYEPDFDFLCSGYVLKGVVKKWIQVGDDDLLLWSLFVCPINLIWLKFEVKKCE